MQFIKKNKSFAIATKKYFFCIGAIFTDAKVGFVLYPLELNKYPNKKVIIYKIGKNKEA